MTHSQHPSEQDRPINISDEDRLDRGPFVDNLVRTLVSENVENKDRRKLSSTGFVVGLTGRWGLGKSSVLNLIKNKLNSMDGVIVVLFNPWLFKGRDELITGFFGELRSAIGHSNTEVARDLVAQVDRYWGAIDLTMTGAAAAMDVYGGMGTASASWKFWKKPIHGIIKPEARSPIAERLALEKKIEGSNLAVVVLIDELDRVEDEEVRAVAQLIKAVGDIRGISYLVAYDPERVVEALGRGDTPEERLRSGERYLEKIIQHPIPLRPLFAEDVKELLRAALEDHGTKLEISRSESQEEIIGLISNSINTPREVKRLVGAFSVLEPAVRDEICPYDVLAYCWLITRSPRIGTQLSANIDRLVSDPSAEEMERRMLAPYDDGDQPNIESVLGSIDPPIRAVLEHLFPRFMAYPPLAQVDWNRLSKRHNLVRMLYLGDPPLAVRRHTIIKLWETDNIDELQGTFDKLVDNGKISAVIDRLPDLLPTLPDGGHSRFWLSLSRALTRSADWQYGYDTKNSLGADAANILYRFGQQSDGGSDFRVAINSLCNGGDLIILPQILRNLLFAHGLTTHSEQPRGDGALSLDETKDLLQVEVPRYRDAVTKGTLLRRVPNAQALYALLNTRSWDDDLRLSLTEQLKSIEAIATFAALMFPPGNVLEYSILNEFIDATEVKKWLSKVETGDLPTDLWLSGCFERFNHVLSGNSLI